MPTSHNSNDRRIMKKIEPHCIQKVNLLQVLYLKDCLITKRHVFSKTAEGR